MPTDFKWTDKMAIGNAIIDAQHKKLVLQSAKVARAVNNGLHAHEVKQALDYLDKYVDEHFTFEEDYLRQRKADDFDEHKEMHDAFRDKIESLRHKLDTKSHGNIMPEDVLGPIIEHIKYENRGYYKSMRRAK